MTETNLWYLNVNVIVYVSKQISNNIIVLNI